MSAETHGEGHVLPLKTYLGTFGALVALTILTVVVSRLGLPSTASVVVALAIAVVKASLVVSIFMHLKYGARFHVFVFAGALAFVLLFFLLTFVDFTTRDMPLAEEDTFYLRQEKAAEAPTAADAPAPTGAAHAPAP